jgi:hypothetical protein
MSETKNIYWVKIILTDEKGLPLDIVICKNKSFRCVKSLNRLEKSDLKFNHTLYGKDEIVFKHGEWVKISEVFKNENFILTEFCFCVKWKKVLKDEKILDKNWVKVLDRGKRYFLPVNIGKKKVFEIEEKQN